MSAGRVRKARYGHEPSEAGGGVDRDQQGDVGSKGMQIVFLNYASTRIDEGIPEGISGAAVVSVDIDTVWVLPVLHLVFFEH